MPDVRAVVEGNGWGWWGEARRASWALGDGVMRGSGSPAWFWFLVLEAVRRVVPKRRLSRRLPPPSFTFFVAARREMWTIDTGTETERSTKLRRGAQVAFSAVLSPESNCSSMAVRTLVCRPLGKKK